MRNLFLYVGLVIFSGAVALAGHGSGAGSGSGSEKTCKPCGYKAVCAPMNKPIKDTKELQKIRDLGYCKSATQMCTYGTICPVASKSIKEMLNKKKNLSAEEKSLLALVSDPNREFSESEINEQMKSTPSANVFQSQQEALAASAAKSQGKTGAKNLEALKVPPSGEFASSTRVIENEGSGSATARGPGQAHAEVSVSVPLPPANSAQITDSQIKDYLARNGYGSNGYGSSNAASGAGGSHEFLPPAAVVNTFQENNNLNNRNPSSTSDSGSLNSGLGSALSNPSPGSVSYDPSSGGSAAGSAATDSGLGGAVFGGGFGGGNSGGSGGSSGSGSGGGSPGWDTPPPPSGTGGTGSVPYWTGTLPATNCEKFFPESQNLFATVMNVSYSSSYQVCRCRNEIEKRKDMICRRERDKKAIEYKTKNGKSISLASCDQYFDALSDDSNGALDSVLDSERKIRAREVFAGTIKSEDANTCKDFARAYSNNTTKEPMVNPNKKAACDAFFGGGNQFQNYMKPYLSDGLRPRDVEFLSQHISKMNMQKGVEYCKYSSDFKKRSNCMVANNFCAEFAKGSARVPTKGEKGSPAYEALKAVSNRLAWGYSNPKESKYKSEPDTERLKNQLTNVTEKINAAFEKFAQDLRDDDCAKNNSSKISLKNSLEKEKKSRQEKLKKIGENHFKYLKEEDRARAAFVSAHFRKISKDLRTCTLLQCHYDESFVEPYEYDANASCPADGGPIKANKKSVPKNAGAVK